MSERSAETVSPAATVPDGTHPITTWRKALYGVGGISSGLKANALGLFLLYYYTDVMLLAPVLAGWALLAGRLWDGVSDVLIGQWSDTYEHPTGRRRAFMIRSMVPYVLFMWAIWAAPQGMEQWQLAVYLGLMYVGLYTCSTVWTVAYYALGAEMSEDYDERTSIAGWRTVFYNLGMLCGSLLPALTVYGRNAGRPPPFGWSIHEGWIWVGAGFSVLMALGCYVPYRGTREPRVVQAEAHPPFLQAIRFTLRNRPFRIVIISSSIKQFGWTLVGGLLVYTSQYWLHQEAHIPGFVVAQIVGGGLAIPLWGRLSQATSKRTAYRVCLNMLSLTFLCAYWLAPDRLWATYLLMAVGGAGVSGNAILSTALIADVCDLDELETGRRREGMFFAVWWFNTKLVSAVGIAIIGFALQYIEYVPNIDQSAYTIEGMRFMFGPLVAFFFSIGAWVFAFFPLTREAHREVRRQLDEQRRRQTAPHK